ncbi:MAG: type VI secretion system tip protein VgrG [Verrucomicrobia bacterium]|nr:type VI secretion system tip protein VgrG [Verrucomicrobiota bacterium]
MAKFTQSHRIAAVGTPLADDHLLLRSMRGTENISAPFRYVVEMLSEDTSVPLLDLMGEGLSIRLNHKDGGGVRYFNGIVADIRQLEPLSGLHRYEAVIVPWLWFLDQACDCRIFQQMTVPAILADVFKSHGFEDFEERLSETYPELEYCVQYGESDLAFVSRLMEEVGIYYFFVHENGKHTLVLADSRAAHDPCPGFPELRYIGPGSNTQGPVDVLSWELRMQAKSGQVIVRDFNFAEPSKLLQPDANDEKNHNLAAFTRYEYTGDFSQDGGHAPSGARQLDNPAKVRLRAVQADFLSAFARSECRGIYTGHTFKLTEHFRQDQNQEYFITATEHCIELDDYVSGRGTSVPVYTVSFVAIPGTVDYCPPRVTARPAINGPQTAIVVGRQGEEIHTDEFGRIKVQFHWDRDGKRDENSSCWVRVAQNWAGKKWGAFFLPRIGQEVIVEFLEGDPDRPIVTGAVYNGEHPTPYKLPAHKTRSTLKSNSSKDKEGHNELRFEDKANKEQIYIHAERDMDVRIKRNMRETNFGDRHIQVGSEEFGQESGDLRVTIHNDENHHIGNDHYLMVDNDAHHVVKGEVSAHYAKSHKTVVADDSVLNADRLIVETSSSISQKTDKFLVQGSSGVHIKGQGIQLEAASISLKCGGNFINIGPGGVSIKGSMVRINSGGSAQGAEKTLKLPEISVFEPLDALLAEDSEPGANVSGIAAGIVRAGGLVMPRKAPELELAEFVVEDLPDLFEFVQGGSEASSTSGLTDGTNESESGSCRRTYLLTDNEKRTDLNTGRMAVLSPNKKGAHELLSIDDLGKKACACPGAQFGIVSTGARFPITQPLKVPFSHVLATYDKEKSIRSLENIRAILSFKPLEEEVCVWCPITGDELKRTQLFIYDGTVRHSLEFDTKKFFTENACFRKLGVFIELLDKISGKAVLKDKTVDEVLVDGFSKDLGLLYFEIKGPKIKFKFEGQWKERTAGMPKENEVYYGMKFSMEAAPFVEASCKVDLIHLILMFPPLAPAQVPYNTLKSALSSSSNKSAIKFEGPPFYFQATLALGGEGTIERAESWSGSLELSLTGTAAIGAEIQMGIVEASGSVSNDVTGTLGMKGDGEGVKLNYDFLKLGKLEGEMKISIDTGWFGKWGKKHKVAFSEGMEKGLVYGEFQVI